MLRVLLVTGIIASVSPLFGQTSSPTAAPSLEQRVADLEAYVTNSPRGVDIGLASSSNIAAPGPSYNAWMMTCAALVLFMTLPGLALFYGGLVRAKNVLSVLAQCLGIAGLVSACAVHSSRAPPRIQKRNHGAAQHGALHGGHWFAVGRLVWFQCR